MKLLILGGTAWLGRQIATEALANGHDVTCVARGTAVPDGARLVRADRDSSDALAGVAAERWDAVIDVARQPGHVRRAVRDLSGVADHYLFVSTANVYASQAEIGADESAPLLAALAADSFTGPDDYGAAKVACEEAILAAFPHALIVRAGLLGGPGDPTGRSTYWPWRFAHPAAEGVVLVPDAPSLPTAVLDVRDLAAWLVRCAETGVGGVFNAGERRCRSRSISPPRDLRHRRRPSPFSLPSSGCSTTTSTSGPGRARCRCGWPTAPGTG